MPCNQSTSMQLSTSLQLIKMIAFSVFGPLAYLSDTWNRLDCFIVLAGCAEYILQEYMGNINLTAIRTIRVLRPLRAVNRIPSMRILGENSTVHTSFSTALGHILRAQSICCWTRCRC